MLQQVTLASLLPALLYLVCGLVIIRFVMSALSRALKRSAIDKTLHRFILTILRIVLYFVLFMTVAGALGIQITSFVALLSVAGLAISLSLQNVLSSASCGVMLLSVKPFKVGDYVMAEEGAKAYAITAIDYTNAAYDVITIGTTLGKTIAKGAYIAEAAAESSASTSELKYKPVAMVGTGKVFNAGDNVDTDAWVIGATTGHPLPDFLQPKGIINY